MIGDIEKAAAVMIANPALGEEELATLVAAQIEGRTQDAWLLVELLPVAFGRIIVERAGVICSRNFMRLLASGKCSRQTPLSSLPYWEDALAYAKTQEAIPASKDEYFAIAGRSAEVRSLNQLFESGASAAGAVSGPVVFLRRLPDESSLAGPGKSPWWQFWK